MHEEANDSSDQATGAEADAAWGKIGKIVGGRDDVGGHVDVEGRHEQGDHGEDDGEGIAKAREDGDGIPKRLAKNDQGGGSDGDADEGIKRHGGGQAEGLADHLIALAAGVAGKVGNVQRNGGPETDDAGERRNEEAKEFAKRLEFRGRGEHGAEAAGFAARPEKKGQADEKQEGCGDALEEANRFDAAQNHENIEQPEENEADRCAIVKMCPTRRERADHGVDGFAANPSLNAKPAAGDEGAENGGDIGAKNAERGAGENGKWDAVLRAGVRVQQHRNQNQYVAEENSKECLAPRQSCRWPACRWGC